MSSSGSIIKLNIGGTVFQTTKSTLTRYDGFFKTILETEIPVTKDETGAIFIDRDPKHFRLVLNFMRDGDVTLPNSEQELEEILKEAQYYLLEGLMEKCKNRIPSEICEIIKRLNEFGAQKEPNPCFQLTVIIHYRIEDWSVVFREISPEQFVYRAPFQTLFKKIDRSKYIPNYWSYTLRYSTTIGSVFKETTLGSENIDVEDFLEELSKNIRELGTGTKLDGFLEF